MSETIIKKSFYCALFVIGILMGITDADAGSANTSMEVKAEVTAPPPPPIQPLSICSVSSDPAANGGVPVRCDPPTPFKIFKPNKVVKPNPPPASLNGPTDNNTATTQVDF